MERGWLEAGKGGPYVPGRHPAEWGGSWSGRGFGPGRPDQPERLRETPVQASPWPGRTHPADRPSRASSDTKAFAGSMVKGASAGQTSRRASQFRPFRGVRQLRSMRLGGQNRRLSNHAGRLTQLPILVYRVPLGDAVGLSPLTQSGARRTVGLRDVEATIWRRYRAQAAVGRQGEFSARSEEESHGEEDHTAC
jgi:hypothetical protein